MRKTIGRGPRPARSIRTRMFYAMFALGICILVASSILSLILLRNSWYDQAYTSFQRTFAQFNSMLELRMGEISQMSYTLINDSNIRSMFLANYSDKYEEYTVLQNVDKLLTSLFSQHSQIRFCMILENEGRVYTNLLSESTLTLAMPRLSFQFHPIDMEKLRGTNWYVNAQKISTSALSYIEDFELPGFPSNSPTLSMLCRFQFSGQQSGYLALIIEDEWLSPLFETTLQDEKTVILSQSGKVLYSYGDESLQLLQLASGLLEQDAPSVLKLDDGRRYIIHHRLSESYNLHILAAHSLQPLQDSLLNTLAISALITVGLAGIALIVSMRQSQQITSPITAITKEIESSPQELHIVLPKNAAHEIHMLVDCLNQMSLRIDLLIQNMLETHLMKKNAEIYALKQQTNPHFLYNIIETINSMSLIHGCEDISSVASHLGSMLRYSLERSNDIVPLSMEIRHLSDYLAINRIRGLEFDDEIDIDPVLMNVLVPKLIVQPLIENCFKHGFKGTIRRWKINIRAWITEDSFCLCFEDNGIGMSSEKRDEVLRSLENNYSNSPESIGVYNVHRRIQLAYGSDYGLTLKSISGEGTRIDLVLPLLHKEVSSDDQPS